MKREPLTKHESLTKPESLTKRDADEGVSPVLSFPLVPVPYHC